jgi:DNA repair protein RadA/Sms
LEETDTDSVVNVVNGVNVEKSKLSAIIIDSIQTMTTNDLSGLAGSVGQVRECASKLLKTAKEMSIPLFLVGHVTKEGTVAGPAVLAHIVDTVLWFEGDKTTTLRLLRAVKNRFGPTDEVGIFEMEERGLISQVNTEKIFLTATNKIIAGSVVSSTLQGTRPMLVEIQSLVVPTKMAFPKRVAQGIDSRRLELLLAVLIRRCGLPLYEYDVFVNIAGGIKVTETASDLAICLSIASAFYDKPLGKGVIAVGEVGLLGEIREVVAQDKRIKEAKRLGFNQPITNKETRYLSEAIKRFVK